ncbi:amidohydrolase family protein [Desulfurobacterium thermolithotrophum]|uniref:amidohydrolase family protein n=1 Tax=Desulfurobacterium thermolithotrophum TaxID=64160 RepID=UPI0013D57DB7|nr:amidohydrolase family protein [Desulfurobacterium thermolithotrophum]
MKILLKANWIVTPETEAIKEGYVVVKNGKIDGYYKKKPEGNFHKVITLKGILYPPFVNAHTHLELSNLDFNPDRFSSFFDWLLWIIGKRQSFSISDIEKAVIKGLKESESYGVGYVGDISSFGISRKFIKRGLTFLEIIGKDTDVSSLPPPLSIHAVYSVSFKLIEEIARDAKERGYKFQIHLGETQEESSFVRCKENKFESLVYPFLGRKRYEYICSENLVSYLKRAGALGENLIAVHCTNLSKKELDSLMEADCSIVLCPRSNIHLKTGFPDVQHLSEYEKVGIGTDGLSTNLSLSVISEIRTIYYRLEGAIPIRKLLRMATYGGAKALGIKEYSQKASFTLCEVEEEIKDPFTILLKDSLSFKFLDFK